MQKERIETNTQNTQKENLNACHSIISLNPFSNHKHFYALPAYGSHWIHINPLEAQSKHQLGLKTKGFYCPKGKSSVLLRKNKCVKQ